jgi:hypothetical protein
VTIDSTGIRPHTAPAVYRKGVALMVVRDELGAPVVAFDGNGTTYFLAADRYLEAHDIPFPITDADIADVVWGDDQ